MMAAASPIEVDPGPVATVRLSRPGVHNALNLEVLRALDGAFADLHARGDVRAIIVTGSGDRAFCAGADLDELAGLNSTAAYDVLEYGQAVFRRIEASSVPVIAAVNGLALGGGFELALATTFPVLAERATLGLPEAGLGLIPGYGGTQRLVHAVGLQVAAHTMLTGVRLTATRAHQLGLTPLPPVADDDLMAVAVEQAQRIASRGPRAVRAILTAARATSATASATGLLLESALAGLATGSDEAAEGIAAFREKRDPDFASTHTAGSG